MLANAPRAQWAVGSMLRRVLYPVLAYPLVQFLGYDLGGVVANFLLALAAVAGFLAYARRKYGPRPALTAGWLLATYPGFTYWGGSPYFYAIIVPACLVLLVIVLEVSEEERLGRVLVLALAGGILFNGYDLMIFFVPASALVLAVRRRPALLAVALVGFVTPYILVQVVLWRHYQVPWASENTGVYSNLLRTYLDWRTAKGWGAILRDAPRIFLVDFFASNFIFLPLLFVALLLGTRRPIGLVASSILLASLALFLVNELAPPYTWRWQIRGTWVARLYEPVFCAFLLYVLQVEKWRWTDEVHRPRWVGAAIALCVAANAAVVFGPILPVRPLTSFAGSVYWAFYRHSADGSLLANVEQHGRRPLGFCRRHP
jgi:hypothetical protein